LDLAFGTDSVPEFRKAARRRTEIYFEEQKPGEQKETKETKSKKFGASEARSHFVQGSFRGAIRKDELYESPIAEFHSAVAQVSQPAVSPISKSAVGKCFKRLEFSSAAGFETCDTADLEICATTACFVAEQCSALQGVTWRPHRFSIPSLRSAERILRNKSFRTLNR
jgi:hypothetical protein